VKKYLYQGLLSLTGALLLTVTGATPVDYKAHDEQEWNFKVYLDDNEIGYHNFSLVEDDDRQRLVTEADFRVRFLFLTAYRYEHTNQEIWNGNCLQEISSKTDANGTKFSVRGYQAGDGFSVESGEGLTEVGDCVKTFAYWNPDILDEPRLLNSQTGELLSVEIEAVAEETLNVRGIDVAAQRYHLVAKNMQLDIWYSKDKRWLALESTVKGNRKLRYELI
jgi:hypothetical protein